MMANVHLLRYLREVFWELPGSWRVRKRIVSRMAVSIRDYVSDESRVSYKQLVERFGEPKQVAFIYVNEMEPDELVEEIRVSKKTVSIIMVAAVMMVLLWTVSLMISYTDHEKNVNGYAVVEIIEVERKLIDEGGN